MSLRIAREHSQAFFAVLISAGLSAAPIFAQDSEKAASEQVTGSAIFKKHCVSCHGDKGEGSKKYKKPLTGDLSIGQLATYIDETMPEEDPDLVVGEDARKVAEYIHESFYSPTAQARNKPPRVELVRLTVRQYRNSVADLLGSFRPTPQKPDFKGLRGEYFTSRRFRNEDRVIDRTDDVVDFNFGDRRPHETAAEVKPDPPKAADEPKDGAKPEIKTEVPKKPDSFGPVESAAAAQEKKPESDAKKPAAEPKKPEIDAKKAEETAKQEEQQKKKLLEEEKRKRREREQKQREEQKKKDEEAKQFAARWTGSVLAPDTGDYEFVVHTENAFRLWVNDNQKPIIDAWVKSGDDKEFRQSIKLLGGRTYLIRLEMFKFREPTASIRLAWRRPGTEVVEPITARSLTPTWSPKRFVPETPFPPDDRSYGYERGSAVSKAWESATTDSAIETANHVLANIDELAGIKRGEDPERTAKIRAFAATFAERAFRRPLAEPQRKIYVDKQFETVKDVDQALRRVVLLSLKSPRFLYPEYHAEPPDAYDKATRLSYALWDSIPDKTLLEAAAADRLKTPEQLQAQADRMSRDPRATQKLREFLYAWLKLEGSPDLAKDPKAFPEFTPEVIADLRTSIEMSLDDFLVSETLDIRKLLTGPEWYANGRLSKVYGLGLPAESDFRKVAAEDKAGRAGIMTHPYMLAYLAYTQTTSPIHRGVFVSRHVLGRAIKPPPIAVAPLAPDLHPGLTTRERTVLQTSPSACVSCHVTINPLGFALEKFDAIGRFRTEEKGKPIDATAEYVAQDGSSVKFDGAKGLAEFVAKSDETSYSMVQQLFHHTVKQPIMAYGHDQPAKLRKLYVDEGYDLRKLMVRSAVTGASGNGSSKSNQAPAVAARSADDWP